MDYEQLFQQMQSFEKDLKDKLAALQRTQKSLAKNSEMGDLKNAAKDLAQMNSLIQDLGAATSGYAGLVESFDAEEYMQGGDFAKQLIACCENLSVDIQGEYPIYDIFPYKIRIDSENQDLYVDRKKVSCLRPQYFVKMLKQSQDKLNKASFNAGAFLNELAAAYDLAILDKSKSGKSLKSGSDLFLKELYTYLVPMQRSRRDYDSQSYAFDLARLNDSEIEITKDGRSFQLGSSRLPGKFIRILDRNGNERHIGTVRFYKPEE